MQSLLNDDERQHVFLLYRRGFACLQAGKYGPQRDEDDLQLAEIFFRACLEWATPDADPVMWAEIRAALNEARRVRNLSSPEK